MGDDENVPILLGCIFAGIIAYVGPLVYLGLTRVKADEMTADGIRVRNVSPPFAASFQQSEVV